MPLLNALNRIDQFIHTDMFFWIFLILCGGGIVGIFLMAVWGWLMGDKPFEIDFTEKE